MGHFWSRPHVRGQELVSKEESITASVKKLTIVLMKLTAEEIGVCEGISRDIFTRHIFKEYPDFSNRIFTFMITNDAECPNTQVLKPNNFQSCAQKIFNTNTYNEVFFFYTAMYSNKKYCINSEEFQCIATLSYNIFVDNHPEGTQACPNGMKVVRSLVEGLYRKNDEFEVSDLVQMTENNCPRMISIIHSYVIHVLCTAYREIMEPVKKNKDEKSSKINAESSLALTIPTPSKVWILATVLPHIYLNSQRRKHEYSILTQNLCNSTLLSLSDYNFPTHWCRIYDSTIHDGDVNSFAHQVFSYKGPTLLFLSGKSDKDFCVCIKEEWHESETFWGGTDCLLIQLSPLYRIVDKGVVIRVNFSSSDVQHGIEIGSNPGDPIMSINDSLDRMTFKNKKIRLHSLEVWGCGPLRIEYVTPQSIQSQQAEGETTKN